MFEVAKYPQLFIMEQPRSEIRFRYITEIKTGHGVIKGENSAQGRGVTYPTVELRNFKGIAYIRCVLYQVGKKDPHPHKLQMNNKNMLTNFIKIGDPYHVVKFPGIHIVQTPIKEAAKELRNTRMTLLKCEARFSANYSTAHIPRDDIKDIDLNRVCLRFDAFQKNRNGSYTKICEPVYSNNINNLKSAKTSFLKIERISAQSATCLGGEKIILLVEKVDKNDIKVRFFCENIFGELEWEEFGDFGPSDVHHQYAITLIVPRYYIENITSRAQVYIQLIRPSDNAVSPPVEFFYEPFSTNLCDFDGF